MSEFRIDVIAATQKAERSLKAVERVADKATRKRNLNIDLRSVNRGLSSVTSDIKSATNNIKTFYKISKNVPGLSDKVEQFEKISKSTVAAAKAGAGLKENAKAGNILANTLGLAASKGNQLLNVLAKIGLATFGVQQAVGVLQSAWNGFFNNTIGREIKLRETILKTQTTLASTNRVFANGREITDPYQKIVKLTSAVGKNIDSIRERSIALAGVTSNEVIEVFGIVAGQVSQIGGGLKEAEDLAINFAAALGTFGIPLYQARQEVGSILRGDITMDSYLAKALGITNEDIAKAKSASGGVVKFLEERLAAAVAGQKIAAEGFSGVVSNIADLGELIGQNFGRGLLDPLLAGLSAVFESLFGIRQQLFGIASAAGKAIGRAGQLVVGLTAGRTGLGAGDPSKAAAAAAEVAQRGFAKLEEVAQRTVGALAQAIEALKPTALILVDAFRNIAEAFINIKVGVFETLASTLANIASVVGALAPSLATVFNIYARFLNTPAVQYFSEVAAVLGLLKRVGLDAITQLALGIRFILSSVVPAVGGLGTALGGLVAVIATVTISLGKLILVLAGLATALVGPATLIPAVAAALKALSGELLNVGKQAVASGTKINGLAAGFRGLGASAKAAGMSIIKSLGWIALIQVGIAVLIDAFGRLRREQENQRSNERAAEALRRLQTTYKDVGDSADSATKSARDFEQAIVNANYTRNLEELEKVRQKIEQVNEAASGGRSGRGASKALQRLLAEETRIMDLLRHVDEQRDKKQRDEDIRLRAQQRNNLEKEIGELRRQIDNDLFQQRQAYARKEVEIIRAEGELRIKQIERANAKLIEGEEGASQAMLAAVNQYISTRERGELAIEAAKKQLTIENANLDKLTSDYRYNMEKKIAELRTKSADYEKKSAEEREAEATGKPGSKAAATKGGVEIPDLDTTAKAFAAAIARLSGAMARLQSITESATRENINKALEGIEKAFPKIAIEDYENQLIGLKVNLDAIAASSEDAFSPERIAIQAQGIQKNVVMQRELEQTFNGLLKNTKLNDAERLQIMTKLEEKYRAYMVDVRKEVELKKSILNSEQALAFITNSRASVEAIQDEIEALQLRNRLVAEGVAPELIDAEIAKLQISRELERISANLSTELATQLDLQTQLNELMKGAEGEELQRLQKRLDEAQAEIRRLQDLLKQVRGAGKGAADAIDARAAAQTVPGQKIKGFIAQAEEQLTDFEGMAIRVSQGVGDAVGNSLTNGIAGLIEGTTTIKDIFADFLKDIGQILLKEAAKMIATYVAIGIAKMFAGLGTSVGDQASLPGVGMGSGDGTFTNIAGNEFGTFGPNFGIRQRANGGPVLGGQPYIVGERGPELFMPSTSGMVLNNNQTRDQLAIQAEAMRGNITEDGLPGSANAATRKQLARQSNALSANTATRQQLIQQQNNVATNSTREIERTYQTALANPSPLDVRFESTVINNTEYVTAEQHRRGMAQAAEQGRSLTLQALQNSVKSRRKVGLA